MTRSEALIGALAALALLSSGAGTAGAGAGGRADCSKARSAVRSQIDAACPCDNDAPHADFVRCVTTKLHELSACPRGADGKPICGPVPRTCVGQIRRIASQSACGKSDAVTCCIPKQHDCADDPAPGDGNPQGKCSGTDRPCDKVGDCLIAKCELAPNAERCQLAGGTLGKGKDCSTACAP
jgi:hypothetical protein